MIAPPRLCRRVPRGGRVCAARMQDQRSIDVRSDHFRAWIVEHIVLRCDRNR